MQSSHPDPEPTSQQEEVLRGWVLNQLKRHQEENDLIQMLCDRTGWKWPQAVEYIQHLRQRYEHQVQRSHTWQHLMIGVSFGAFGAFLLWMGLCTNQINLQFLIERFGRSEKIMSQCREIVHLRDFLIETNVSSNKFSTFGAIWNFMTLFAPYLGFGLFLGGVSGAVDALIKLLIGPPVHE